MQATFDEKELGQLKRLSKIFKLDSVISTEDAHELLRGVADIMLSFKQSNLDLNKDTEKKVKDLFEKVLVENAHAISETKKNSDSADDTKKKLDLKSSETIKKIETMIADFISKKPKDGAPGHTPVKGKDYFDGKNGSPDVPEQVRDKLESLKKGKKLSINAIDELSDTIEDLYTKIEKQGKEIAEKSTVSTPRASGRVYKFTDDEIPVNTGDDTNFRLRKAPVEGSLKLYRNGSRQKLTADYTLSGRMITLVLPLQDPSEILLVDYRHY